MDLGIRKGWRHVYRADDGHTRKVPAYALPHRPEPQPELFRIA